MRGPCVDQQGPAGIGDVSGLVAEGRHRRRSVVELLGIGVPSAAKRRSTDITRRVMLMGMIRSFGNPMTERLWSRERTKKLDPRLERTALRKLAMLDAAEDLNDLRVPPGNRLEALRADRAGQHSIRINQQWRICFTWAAAGPENVEIIDYH